MDKTNNSQDKPKYKQIRKEHQKGMSDRQSILTTRQRATKEPISRKELTDIIGKENWERLNDEEQSVMMILCNLSMVPYPLDAKIQAAGIAPTVWYEIIQDEGFTDCFTGVVGNMVKNLVAQVWLSIAYYAMNGSAPMARILMDYYYGPPKQRKSGASKAPTRGSDPIPPGDQSRKISDRITRQIKKDLNADGIPGAKITTEKIEPGDIKESSQDE